MSDPVSLNRITVRQKQVSYGKNTLGYDNYLVQYPDKFRRPTAMPRTPDATLDIPTKRWAGMIKAWRKGLHAFDPDGGGGEGGVPEDVMQESGGAGSGGGGRHEEGVVREDGDTRGMEGGGGGGGGSGGGGALVGAKNRGPTTTHPTSNSNYRGGGAAMAAATATATTTAATTTTTTARGPIRADEIRGGEGHEGGPGKAAAMPAVKKWSDYDSEDSDNDLL